MQHVPMFSAAAVLHACPRLLPDAFTTDPKVLDAAASLNAAHHLVGSDRNGLFDRLYDKLSNGDDCCIQIASLGGSNACGHGSARHPWLRHQQSKLYGLHPAGVNRTYAALLVDWLSRGPTAACCRRGHEYINLCQGGAGTSYFVETFEPSRLAKVDLLLVDVAPNDQNAFVLRFLKHKSNTQTKVSEAEKLTERFVRTLLKVEPQPPALLYVTTAWFVDELEGDLPEDQVHGAWPSQVPVLRHYGIPATHMPMLLRRRARANDANFSHHCWYIDPPHYSLEAHTLQAWLLARSLAEVCARRRFKGAADAPAVPRGLPPPLFSGAADEERVDLIDFSDRTARFRSAILRDGFGWHWVEAVKKPGAGYQAVEVPAGALPVAVRGKIGYTARHGDATFEVLARFRTGQLHVMYMRSYSHMGAANVTIWHRPPPGHATSSARLVSAKTLNGTWTLPYSLYTMDTIKLPRGSFRANASLLVRFSRLADAPGPFTVYTIATY